MPQALRQEIGISGHARTLLSVRRFTQSPDHRLFRSGRGLLLAGARKLAGSDEGGMELFQQTLLNCHDAIQRNGFNGDRYEFYLLRTLRHAHHRSVFVRKRSDRRGGGTRFRLISAVSSIFQNWASRRTFTYQPSH